MVCGEARIWPIKLIVNQSNPTDVLGDIFDLLSKASSLIGKVSFNIQLELLYSLVPMRFISE